VDGCAGPTWTARPTSSSRSSLPKASRDRGDKILEYEQGRVREYWPLDPDRQQAELYQLGADGHYRLALGGSSGRYTRPALDGFPLSVEWLWRKPLPKLLDVLRELALV
jgi:hypothetical protein